MNPMNQSAVEEAIRRVETTPLRELVNVSVEDVQAQMDSLLNPELDSSSFYHRWETQQWAVSDLDFSQDVKDWANLPEPVQNACANRPQPNPGVYVRYDQSQGSHR